MAIRRPSRTALLITGGSAAGFALWTLLVGLGATAGWDRTLQAPRLSRDAPLTQVAAALAVVTWPGVLYLGLLVLAAWSWRRRMRSISRALVLVVPIAWLGDLALKWALARDRPESGLSLITDWGYSYPSGHLTAITVTLTMITATMAVSRRGTDTARGWGLGATVALLAIGVDRWLLSAHWVSDLVGGLLWGLTSSALALILAGVTVLPPKLQLRSQPAPVVVEQGTRRRCAVVYNPTKVLDLPTFRRHVEYELTTRGWDQAIWLETTPTDPGWEMTAIAVRKQVDLVIGAGGDGTIRVVCAGLAGTGIPFGLIPAGTGNLLAKNLGVPLDELAALRVAFNGVDTPTDLVKLTTDQGVDRFAVMAGMGIDAVILGSTNPELKKVVGSAAYFVSAAQHANHPPVEATVQVGSDEPFRCRASIIVFGNVGFLQAGIHLLPGARADDGLVDLMIATPRGPRDWVRLTAKVLSRQRRRDEQLLRYRAARIQVSVEREDPFQLDGDTEGVTRSMLAEVEPGALTLRLPGVRASG